MEAVPGLVPKGLNPGVVIEPARLENNEFAAIVASFLATEVFQNPSIVAQLGHFCCACCECELDTLSSLSGLLAARRTCC